MPLLPATQFRTSNSAAAYHLEARDVLIPGVSFGDTVTLRMRAWEGEGFDSGTLRGESNDFTVRFQQTSPNLVGLRGFTLAPKGTPVVRPPPAEPPPPIPVSEGVVVFNNRVAGLLDAPVKRPDGTGAGAGVTAQLFLVGSDGALTPLWPVAQFRTSIPAAAYYIQAPERCPLVPGASPGDMVTLRMRAWAGSDYESAPLRGESIDFSIRAGGGSTPPSNLVGLQGFTLVPQLWLSVVRGNDGRPAFRAVSTGPSAASVEASDDLISWETVSSNTPVNQTGGAMAADLFKHKEAKRQRFYRVVSR